MMPRRLRMGGFLGFREACDFDFTRAPAWRFTGDNGSGKSSAFDALTWALFGLHRGGSLPGELLHRGHDDAEIDLDFDSAKGRFRIVRKLHRGKDGIIGLVQAFAWSNDRWEPVPGTDRRHGFDDWLRDHLGLDAQYFLATSALGDHSLLSLASRARAEVLAHAIDFARLDHLARHAASERARREALLAHSEPVVEDTPLNVLAEAEADADAAGAAVALAEEEWLAAMRKEDFRKNHERCEAKWSEARNMLGEAEAIERDYARLQELQAHLPSLDQWLSARERIADSEARRKHLESHREASRLQKANLDEALDALAEKRSRLRDTIAEKERRIDALAAKLRSVAIAAQSHREHETIAAEVEHLQQKLADYPSDFEASFETARRRAQRYAELQARQAEAQAIAESRARASFLESQRSELLENFSELRRRGEAARRGFDSLTKDLRLALAAAETAKADAERAAVRLEAARASVAELALLDRDDTCHFCGQPLTPEHRAAETERRQHAVEAAGQALQTAVELRNSSSTVVECMQREHHDAEAELLALRARYRDAQTELEANRSERARLASIVNETREPINPAEFAALENAEATLAALEARYPEWQAWNDRLQKLSEALARLTPAADAAWQLESLQSEEAGQRRTVKALRKELDDLEREIDKQSRKAHEALAEWTEATGHIKLEEAAMQLNQKQAAEFAANLPESWQHFTRADYQRGQRDLESLRQERIVLRHRQLAVARLHADALRADAEQAERAWRDSPGDLPERCEAKLKAARTALATAESLLANVRMVESQRERRRERQSQLDAARRQAALELPAWQRLESELGPEGLRKTILQRFERQLIAKANLHLEALAPGLQLALAEPGQCDSALHLLAIDRRFGHDPIGVPFLSAGQRVLAGLALALAFEPPCLWIDHGLERLDPTHRTRTIRHLLASNIPRLIAATDDEAIPDGYRFEITRGVIRISRLGV